MDTKYEYIENDNAWFRKRADSGLCCIDEVWTADGWKPYTGDGGKPYLEGKRINEAEVPAFRKPDRSGMVNLTGTGSGRAFEIIGAPGGKPTKP